MADLKLDMSGQVIGKKSKILSAAEVQEAISDLARDGEGADRRWALKVLAGQSSSVGLPDPLTDQDATMRLARLMQGYGREISRVAFRKAFDKVSPGDPFFVDDEDTGLPKQQELPQTLDEFFLRFPNQQPASYPVGYPKGFPYRGTDQEKHLWIIKRSMSLIQYERKKARAARNRNQLAKLTAGEAETPSGGVEDPAGP